MKLRNFFKSLLLGSVVLPAQAVIKPTFQDIKFIKLKVGDSLETFKEPQTCDFSVNGVDYTITALVTADILIPCVDDAGNTVLHTNCYRDYVKVIARCHLKDINAGDKAKGFLFKKYESDLIYNGKLTVEEFKYYINDWIVQFKDAANKL